MEFYDTLMQRLLGAPDTNLSAADADATKRNARMSAAAALLAGSGPSEMPRSTLQNIGGAIMAGRNATTESADAAMRKQFMAAQIQAMLRKQGGQHPASVQEYEYAKQNGFPGTFQEWQTMSATGQRPAGIQEYEYFSKLDPEGQKRFMALQRSPVVPQIALVNGVPTLVDRTGTTAPQPLSSQESEIDAVRRKAAAESEAKATGSAAGEARGAVEKKSIAALSVMDTLDLADPLIDVATGSSGGAAIDKLASFFGVSPTGDQAIGQLRVLQADLMTKMPRMEGPQSDRDVQLYREAAGEIGDPNVPRARKKAAISMIRSLQMKYAEAGTGRAPRPSSVPKAGTVEDGYRFKGGDPSKPENWEKT